MPPPIAAPSPVVVLCPMQVERDHVRRALKRAGLDHIQVVQTGIGKHAIVQSAQRVVGRAASPPFLVLAGACGGLREVEDVPPIARVIDEHGQSWTPANGSTSGVTLIAVDTIISTPADKRTLASQTGASIVDMECHAFAAWCESNNVRWAVVRGVSDTPEETLPHQVLDWIAPSGDTKPLRAARDLVLSPTLIPHVIGFLRRCNRVLPQVGDQVVAVVRAQLARESTSSGAQR